MTFDPTGGHLGPQYLAAAAAAHLNGTRPFLPYAAAAASAYNAATAGHAMIPNHPLIPGRD